MKILLAFAITLFLLAVWIVVPAPHRLLLPLAVGAPELSAWLLLAAGAVGIVSLLTSEGGALAWGTRALAAVVTVVAALPLIRLPSVILSFNDSMRPVVGSEQPGQVPAGGGPSNHRATFVVSELFLGIQANPSRIARGLSIASPGGARLTVDVYRPLASGRYPVVVQLYGGAWQRGGPGDNAGFTTALAADGFVVFAIDYRHAPAWRWPAQIEDVRKALAWVHTHAADYDGNPARMTLLGRSSGAQLAMIAAYEPGAPPIAAVVGLYGPVDLVDGYRHPPVPDPLDVRSIEEAFLGGTPAQVAAAYRAASPATYAVRRQPPSLLIYGARDHVVQSRYGSELAARLRASGGQAIFLEIPWAGHAFDSVPHGPSGQLALHYVERFLRWAVRPGAPDQTAR